MTHKKININNDFDKFIIFDLNNCSVNSKKNILKSFCNENNIFLILNDHIITNVYKEYQYLEQSTKSKTSNFSVDDITAATVHMYRNNNINNSDNNNNKIKENNYSKLNNLITLLENFNNHISFNDNKKLLITSDFRKTIEEKEEKKEEEEEEEKEEEKKEN